jgi:molybdate transport system permease protein
VDWTAILTSLELAFTVTLVLIVVGIPLAYWLAFSTQRWKFLVESAVALPLILPPTVLGFYVLMALGPRGLGTSLPFTFKGLIVGSTLYSLPFAVQPIVSAFRSVNRRLIEASWTLGVSRMGTFRRVIMPQSLAGLLTGAVLSFAHTIGEFGVVLMIGGNIQGQTRTVSIAIYDDVQALDYAGANATALALVIFSFITLAVVYALNQKKRAGWAGASLGV